MTDWSPLIIGIVAALPPTILAVATLIQGIRTHQTFNSKMDAMLELAKKASFAEGQKAEKDESAKTKADFAAGQAAHVVEEAVIAASKKLQDGANQPN